MLWEEEKEEAPYRPPEDIIDLTFAIRGRTLPVDHAWALAEALRRALPWLAEAPEVGIHLHLGAEEGNGWFQAGSDELLYLSRRTRLTLRVPTAHEADALTLCGQCLDVAGHPLEVGAAERHLLSLSTTLYARHVASEWVDDEPAMLEQIARELAGHGIRARKAVCGRARSIGLPDGVLRTRSLMLADLSPEESVTLQRTGLGGNQQLGCGLFVPHKSIKKVQPSS